PSHRRERRRASSLPLVRLRRRRLRLHDRARSVERPRLHDLAPHRLGRAACVGRSLRLARRRRLVVAMRTRLLLTALTALAALLAACNRSGSRTAITGTLTLAGGSGAPLTASGASVGTNFAIEATLGDAPVAASAMTWRCFAPVPPLYP